MSTTRYSYDIDLDDLNKSHTLAVLSVTPASRVLDVGAADGSVARALVSRGCRVSGVEIDKTAAREAATICEQVVVDDAERLDFRAAFPDSQFDVVMFLDVLEHFRDPLAVLTRAKAVLSPNGRVIASIPNVTHGAVRLSLMRGSFTYTETGLLDRTHLRFFDRKAVHGLFEEAKLEILEELRVRRGFDETEIPINLADFSTDVLEQVGNDPESTTYQFVIVAAARVSDAAKVRNPTLAEQLQQELTRLGLQYRNLERHAQSLQRAIADAEPKKDDGRDARIRELEKELSTRMEELRVRDLELRHIQADLAVKEAFATELREQLLKRDSAPVVIAPMPATLPPPAIQPTTMQRVARVVDAKLRGFPALHGAVRSTYRRWLRG